MIPEKRVIKPDNGSTFPIKSILVLCAFIGIMLLITMRMRIPETLDLTAPIVEVMYMLFPLMFVAGIFGLLFNVLGSRKS